MALQGKHRVIGVHAVAIVDDAQQPFAALANFDAQLGRAGIQAIFQQFLRHISRPLDNLAGSNFGRHIGW